MELGLPPRRRRLLVPSAPFSTLLLLLLPRQLNDWLRPRWQETGESVGCRRGGRDGGWPSVGGDNGVQVYPLEDARSQFVIHILPVT